MNSENGIDIEAFESVCGCGGKTSLESVVYPAIDSIEQKLRDLDVDLAPTAEAATLPRTEEYHRTVSVLDLDDDEAEIDAALSEGETWCLTATLADERVGNDQQEFAETIGGAYQGLSEEGLVTIGKAHSIQLINGGTPLQWFEFIDPVGEEVPGFLAGNVDVIHAFPGIGGQKQAEIATYHSLNDCYALGAHENRRIRPIVAVPERSPSMSETVKRWYAEAIPDQISVLEPSLLEHGGDGWMFGAAATASGRHEPSSREASIEVGDGVLLHRPCGGLALYTLSLDQDDDELRQRALDTLLTDHLQTARTIAEFCPDVGEEFDPEEHVKFATDISGPGIMGIVRAARKSEKTIHITEIPMVDAPEIEQVRSRWVVPDMTLETNGPMAIVARPSVLADVSATLSAESDADPVEIGEFVDRRDEPFSVDDSVSASDYVETLARHDT